jgi:hypothetical protein
MSSEMTADPRVPGDNTAEDLLGELIRELSELVRGELELAAARRGPELRRLGAELAAALPALAAALLALAALSSAAGLALADAIPGYAAALVVAAAFGLLAATLGRLEHPRRLLRRLAGETGRGAAERAERERAEAERLLRATAERLVKALARDAAERELAAPVEEAGELLGAAGREGGDIMRELLLALLAPGRAGFGLLEALAGRRERPATPPAAAPRRRSPERPGPGG